MEWWQPIIYMISGMAGVILSFVLGGWLVFRTKTITMPTPMIQSFSKKESGAKNYLPGSLNETPPDDDDELSSAAARLRGQKADPPRNNRDKIMAFVKGAK